MTGSLVEPVPDAPAAVVDGDGERALAIADYHAGIEIGLRYERGVELDSAAERRRKRLLTLLDRTAADRLIVLGDIAHRISAPDGQERAEIESLIDAVTARVPLTLVQGNHDGGVAAAFADRIDIAPVDGTVYGDVGFVHGHTWPRREILETAAVCVGHEHPQVRLQDEVGGSRVERAWLRGRLDPSPFRAEGVLPEAGSQSETDRDPSSELIVFPAFNDRSGGTWVNVDNQSFLSPFLPAGLADGEAYLLDGTRLGPYTAV